MAYGYGDTMDEAGYGIGAWTAPSSFYNSWASFSSGGVQGIQYRTIGDRVQVRGYISSGTVGYQAFQIGPGTAALAPPLDIAVICHVNNGGTPGIGYATIDTSAILTPWTTGNTYQAFLFEYSIAS